MLTTSITIRPHLAEYAQVIFAVEDENYIKIPHTHDLYHILANLMAKRPENRPIHRGNLEIALPAQSRGKCPIVYNYISDKSQKIIDQKIECLFWAHAHEFVDNRYHMQGEQMKDAMYMFLQKYQIESISLDAIVKNYYRWRYEVRRKRFRRGYKKANIHRNG